jgi:hypothetical protein
MCPLHLPCYGPGRPEQVNADVLLGSCRSPEQAVSLGYEHLLSAQELSHGTRFVDQATDHPLMLDILSTRLPRTSKGIHRAWLHTSTVDHSTLKWLLRRLVIIQARALRSLRAGQRMVSHHLGANEPCFGSSNVPKCPNL